MNNIFSRIQNGEWKKAYLALLIQSRSNKFLRIALIISSIWFLYQAGKAVGEASYYILN